MMYGMAKVWPESFNKFGLYTDKAELGNYKPMKSHKAIFLSMHGGGDHKDPVSGVSSSLGIVLCYLMPIKQIGKMWS